MKEIQLQNSIRDNFIVALVAYIKVGNPEQFVDDLETITNFFSRFHKADGEIYARLCNSSNEYNIINDKVEALINYIKNNQYGKLIKRLKEVP